MIAKRAEKKKRVTKPVNVEEAFTKERADELTGKERGRSLLSG